MGDDGEYDERAMARSFMVDLHNAYPKQAKISRRSFCRVDVGPDPKNWYKVDQRNKLL